MIDGGQNDPQNRRLYTIDYTTRLSTIALARGVTNVKIVTSVWSVTPSGPTIGTGGRAPTISPDGKKVSFWWDTGGTPGILYSFLNHITCDDSPASERDETLTIQAAAQ